MKRRQFIGLAGNTSLFILAGGLAAGFKNSQTNNSGAFAFLEAEGFDDHGGWELDQQSMDNMGSPYLLAHGLGIPVKDATTTLHFPSAGTYRIWVRTKDWVAPFDAPGAPGKFQILIDNKALKETFGTKGARWHWHDGGTVSVNKAAKVALHDLTGFEGRCEAILFCKDLDFEPTNNVDALKKFRRNLLGWPEKPQNAGSFDLVVAGGGLAGICSAVSAARQGLSVALVQDRPVLGGNGSSEVRVWPEGHIQQEPYPHIGDIVDELLPPIQKHTAEHKWYNTMNGTAASNFDDQRKIDVVKAEKNITLFLNHRAVETQTKRNKITAIVAENTLTGEQKLVSGSYFADCTGDAKLGYQAGADYEFEFSADNPLMGSSNLFNVLDASDEKQVLECECKDKSALVTQYEKGEYEQPFPRCPWALDLSDKPFPGRSVDGKGKDGLKYFANRWYWESGFNMNQVEDIELIRDHNFRAMYGAWDALKNVDNKYPNYRLGWSAFIAGKRESRRLMGDVVLDADDFRNHTPFTDAAYPCSWHIDVHFPREEFEEGFEGNAFISDYTRGKGYEYGGIYWAPYRTLYSRNIDNLFMAGRNISVTKMGLGPVRVMKTTGTMGEIVGKAAAVCKKHKVMPGAVYKKHLEELKALMKEPGSK